ncbi:ribonuclease H-like domain-containing protein [Tanacetum coccineum]
MNKGHTFVALLVYVDDIVFTRNDISEITRFKDLLSSKFNIKDLGKLYFFLGIEVIETDKELILTQRKYCMQLLHEFGLSACKPISVPMPPNFILPFKPTDEDPFLENTTDYQQLIGNLIYLTHTRPDIAYFVHCLAQHMHSPLKYYVESALDVLRYLKGSQDLGVEPSLPVTLHYDNKSAFQLANNLVFHERSKYFELDVHFIREKIAKGCLCLLWNKSRFNGLVVLGLKTLQS